MSNRQRCDRQRWFVSDACGSTRCSRPGRAQRLDRAERDFLAKAGIDLRVLSRAARARNTVYAIQSVWLIHRELKTWMTTADLARRLRIPRAEVRSLRKNGNVVAARLSTGRRVYPEWQFRDERILLPAPAELVNAFPCDYRPLGVANFMLDASVFDGRTPRQLLIDGRRATVLRAIRDLSRI